MPYLHSNIEHHNLDSVFAGVKQFFFFFICGRELDLTKTIPFSCL